MTPARPLRLAQWQLLRQLRAGPRAENELAIVLGRRPQAIAKSLLLLEERGLVIRIEEREHAAPNAPARRWEITDEGRDLADEDPPAAEPLASDDDDSRTPGFLLGRHQSFLAATIGSRDIPSLLETLATGEQAAEASFVARVDGEAHGYVFFFDERLGTRPTETLAAALNAAHLPYTAGRVSEVRTVDEFVRDALAAREAADRVRRDP
jgi:DNA-binding MarR family transcriptional regulator